MSDSEKPAKCAFDGRDVVVIGPPNGSGHSCMRHRADHTVEIGTMRRVEEGTPVHGELISLKGEGPYYDAETVYDGRDAEESEGSGPAKVTSEAYRRGWDSVFGKSPAVGQA